MSEIKLIFTGSVGAGKTTAIATISDIPVINTDVRMTEFQEGQKEKTTVAMDYGELTLEDGQKLRLYGTPGQQRFDYMWKILTKGGLGLIILIDDSMVDPVQELDSYLSNFQDFIQETAVVVGITHTDMGENPTLQAYYEYLQGRGLSIPLMAVDARSRDNVVMLLQTLLAMLEFG